MMERKRGRPKAVEKKIKTQTMLLPDEYMKLQESAKKEKKSISEFIRAVLLQYMEEQP